MKYKIIKYNKEGNDFEAITEDGNKIKVDPYVGCAYNGKSEDLIDKWFKTEDIHYHRPLLLPGENDFIEVREEE